MGVAMTVGHTHDPKVYGGLGAGIVIALAGALTERGRLRELAAVIVAVSAWGGLFAWHVAVPIPQVDVVSPLGVDAGAPLAPAGIVVLACAAWPALLGARRWIGRGLAGVALVACLFGAFFPQTYHADMLMVQEGGARVEVLDGGKLVDVRWERDLAPMNTPVKTTGLRVRVEGVLGAIAAGLGSSIAPEQGGLRRALWSSQRWGVAASLWMQSAVLLLSVPIFVIGLMRQPEWALGRRALAAAPWLALGLPWAWNLLLLGPALVLAEASGFRISAVAEVIVGALITGLTVATARALATEPS